MNGWSRLVAVLLISLFGTLITAGDAMAESSPEHTDARILALQYDKSTQTLIKATASAVQTSKDGGRTWTGLPLPRLKSRTAIAAIAVSAPVKNKYVLYIAGPGIGVQRTEDAGKNWLVRSQGVPKGDVVALAAHADQPNALFVVVAGKGIFRSEDGGSRWKQMDGGPRAGISRLIHSNMPGSMQTGWFFAATGKGVSRSMDCFCGWRDAGALGRPVHAITYDPRQPQRVYAAGDEQLFVSVDGGEQWKPLKAPAPEVTALVATSTGVVYAGTRDGILFRSDDQGASWKRADA